MNKINLKRLGMLKLWCHFKISLYEKLLPASP